MKSLPLSLFLLPLLASGLPAQNENVVPVLDEATAEAIRQEGINNSHVMEYLKELTDLSFTGGRLTGSDNFTRASHWLRKQFQDMGLDARLEKWAEWGHAWNRGKWEGRVLTPIQMDLFVATPAWTAGTDGTVQGPLLVMPQGAEALAAMGERARGAFLFSPGGFGRRGPAAEIVEVAEELGVAGFVYAASGIPAFPTRIRVFGSSQTANLDTADLPTIPQIAVRADHAAKLQELLARGQRTNVEFNIENEFREGGILIHNVVGELRGTEKPDEVVIVGGHLDSWHQATGTTDNGTGTTSFLEAARILTAVGAKPKRTIRFIGWGGEEQGLLGSKAYVLQHADEVEKISALFNHDSGTNWAASTSATPSMYEDVLRVVAPILKLNSPDPDREGPVFTVNRTNAMAGGGGGSDHASFIAVGVPALSMRLTGRADYSSYTWHSQWDLYEAAIPEYQRHTSTVLALAALGVANLPNLLNRSEVGPNYQPPVAEASARRGGRGQRGGRRGGRGGRGRRGGGGGGRTGLAADLGVDFDGMVFGTVDGNGTAGRAGIRQGDVLKGFNGREIDELADMWLAVREGVTECKLTIQRGQEEVEVEIDPAALRRSWR
jgi:hypothetical protein